MRYQMKQKMFSLGDDYVITDENGREAYYVDGKAFSIGEKLSFQDMQRRELAYIRQRLLSIGPTYEIWYADELHATVKKQLFTMFHTKFSVDVPGPDDLEAEGDFHNHEYTFTRAGQPVASVSKQWFSFTDTYGVEVSPGEDDVLILASSVVIDLCCYPDHKGQ